MNSALAQFRESATRLASVAKFDLIQLGLVVTAAPEKPRTIIALSARLVRGATSPAVIPSLATSRVSAYQLLLPIAELGPLLAQLDSGVLERVRVAGGGTTEFTEPLVLPLARGEEPGWDFDRKSEIGPGFACMVSMTGVRLRDLMQREELDDALLAQETGYTYASLSRVIKAFTGLNMSRASLADQRCRLEFVVPWPLHALAVSKQDDSLRVELQGLSSLDSSLFILNVEGMHHDERFDSKVLRWQTVPSVAPDTATYLTRVDVRGIGASAVNLYVAGVPELLLHGGVKNDEKPLPASHIESIPARRLIRPPQDTAAPEGARLTRLHVASFRLLRSIELDLTHPLAVIVGPNQSGKSSILDALQLLSESARGDFSDALGRRRGGLASLLTRGADSSAMVLEADLATPSTAALRYRISVSPRGAYDFSITDEQLSARDSDGRWLPFFTRQGSQATLPGVTLNVPNERESVLSQLRVAWPVIESVRAALAAIAIYPYFRTGAAWADPEAVPMRRPVRPEPGARLDRSGDNLVAVLSSLRDERPADWEEYLGIVRLAFPSLKDLRMPAVSRGTVQLFWDEVSGQSFDASEVSDGTLSFLAILCALFQPGSALIAVDEPEQHLHPDALRRLMGAARSLSDRQPIVFATQSDALIGQLDETPEAIVIASRGPEGTELVRPDLRQLQEWLKTFSLRDMRRDLEGWSPET